jgi:hypothetical protein
MAASGESRQVAFARALPLSPSAAVALEDYARVLTGSAGALVLHEGEAVSGVRLDGAKAVSEDQGRDIEAFARSLADAGQGGLGWS